MSQSIPLGSTILIGVMKGLFSSPLPTNTDRKADHKKWTYAQNWCHKCTHTHTGKVYAHNRPKGPKGFPGRLRPRIFLMFGTTREVGRQPHAPAAFTSRGIPWYSFLEAESTPGHMVPSVATEKIPSVTPPRIDPETVRLVAQCLNHYATPAPRHTHSVHIQC
jgi:hypothetical protein